MLKVKSKVERTIKIRKAIADNFGDWLEGGKGYDVCDDAVNKLFAERYGRNGVEVRGYIESFCPRWLAPVVCYHADMPIIDLGVEGPRCKYSARLKSRYQKQAIRMVEEFLLAERD